MSFELWFNILVDKMGILLQFQSFLYILYVLNVSLWVLMGDSLGGVGMLCLLVHVGGFAEGIVGSYGRSYG